MQKKKSATELISDAYKRSRTSSEESNNSNNEDNMKFKTPWGSRKKSNSSQNSKLQQGTARISIKTILYTCAILRQPVATDCFSTHYCINMTLEKTSTSSIKLKREVF